MPHVLPSGVARSRRAIATISAAILATLATGVVAVEALPAHAAQADAVAVPTSGSAVAVDVTVAAKSDLGLRSGPNYEFAESARLLTMQKGVADCRATGTAPVAGPGGSSSFWDKVTLGGRQGYVPETFLAFAGTARPPTCTDAPAYPPEGHQGWETEEGADKILDPASMNGPCVVLQMSPHDCGDFKNSTRDSLRIAWLTYRYRQSPDKILHGQEDRRDALRHCLWQGLMTVRAGHNTDLAANVGGDHEIQTGVHFDWSRWYHLFINNDDLNSGSAKMDLWNNEVARRAAARSDATESSVIDFCTSGAANAHQMTDGELAALGVTVRRNDLVNGDYLVFSNDAPSSDPDYNRDLNDVADPARPVPTP
jgi:hypothetical protein